MVVERESFMISYPVFRSDHIDLQETLETETVNIRTITIY